MSQNTSACGKGLKCYKRQTVEKRLCSSIWDHCPMKSTMSKFDLCSLTFQRKYSFHIYKQCLRQLVIHASQLFMTVSYLWQSVIHDSQLFMTVSYSCSDSNAKDSMLHNYSIWEFKMNWFIQINLESHVSHVSCLLETKCTRRE